MESMRFMIYGVRKFLSPVSRILTTREDNKKCHTSLKTRETEA